VGVAKLWDDLRLGVISLSNLVTWFSAKHILVWRVGVAAEVGQPPAVGLPRPLDLTKAAAHPA